MKAKRRLLKIHVDFISLVGKGANQKIILWKSAQNVGYGQSGISLNKRFAIVKVDDDQQLVTGIVYAPEEVDTEGDTASAEVIKAAAYAFMEETQTDQVDKSHNEKADEGFVAESWIVRKGDPTFDEVGAWAVVIKVTDDKTWQEIKRGEITGLSMGGRALAQDIDKSKGDAVKFNKQSIIEVIKAWYELRISGDIPGAGSADAPSVQEQLAGVFKATKAFDSVTTQAEAEAALAVVKETADALTASAREVLKDHLPPADPSADPEKPSDPENPDAEPDADIAKLLKSGLQDAVAPVLAKMEDLAGRLKTIEDSPLGPNQLDPEGGVEAPVNKDGHRIVQIIKRVGK